MSGFGGLSCVREVVEGARDEGVLEFDSEYLVKRGPDGGIAHVGGDLAKAFERELDGTIRGIRGGGAGADAAPHAGLADELRRTARQYMDAMAAEVVSRLRSRGVRHARCWTGDVSGEGDDRRQDVHCLAWARGGRVIAETTVRLNGDVLDVLALDRGRGFIAQMVNAMVGAGARDGVVIG